MGHVIGFRTRAGAFTALEAQYMSRKLDVAGTIAIAATFAFTLLSADGSGAVAKPLNSRIAAAPQVEQPSEDLNKVDPLPANPEATGQPVDTAPSAAADDADADAAPSPATLAELVAAQPIAAPLSRELNCLAGAIYFESKSEPLLGQLAVGRVIVARSRSGRFPNSYCGVVFQPSQFSFVRGGGMPAIDKNSRYWKNAVALAQIANDGSWKSPVEGALYFHAARVSPGWRMARVGRLGNHVFYR